MASASLGFLLHVTQVVCWVSTIGVGVGALATAYDVLLATVVSNLSRHLRTLKVFTALTAVAFCAVCTVSAFASTLDVCETAVHFVGLTYPLCKFVSYLFLFVKSRLVRPLSVMNRFEKVLLFATSLIVPFAACCGVWVQGTLVSESTPTAIIVACFPKVPPVLAIVMICADNTVSVGYIVLFVQPLYNLAEVEQKYHSLIRRNLAACVVTIIGTLGAMLWIVLCDYDVTGVGDKMRVTLFCGGVLDMNVTLWTIVVLSRHKRSTNRVASSGGGVGTEQHHHQQPAKGSLQKLASGSYAVSGVLSDV